MAVVIRAFKERFHDMKKYDVGDEYPERDSKRVTYLVKAGYLQEPERQQDKSKRSKKGVGADGDPIA